MTKFKKTTSLSLSFYLSICRCTLIFLKGSACTSLSLFLSLFTFAKTIWIQIRPEWNSGKNVSLIKNLHMRYKVCKVTYKSRCARSNGFSVYLNKCIHCPVPCADPEGGQGVRVHPPLKYHKDISFLSNSGPDPLEFSKLPSQYSTLGQGNAI